MQTATHFNTFLTSRPDFRSDKSPSAIGAKVGMVIGGFTGMVIGYTSFHDSACFVCGVLARPLRALGGLFVGGLAGGILGGVIGYAVGSVVHHSPLIIVPTNDTVLIGLRVRVGTAR
jgi:hypothetical protein